MISAVVSTLAALTTDDLAQALLPGSSHAGGNLTGVLPSANKTVVNETSWCDYLTPGQQCSLIQVLNGSIAGQGPRSAVVLKPNASAYRAEDALKLFRRPALLPTGTTVPLPLLLWFHGVGADASECTFHVDQRNESIAAVANRLGFAVVCFEALQFATENRPAVGYFRLPEVQTDETPCELDASIDLAYVDAVLSKLDPTEYDLSSVYVGGFSRGALFATYAASCLRRLRGPSFVTAFATQSAGLKIKGDGISMPVVPGTEYTDGECPSCKYSPFVPKATPGLRACIFDGTADTTYDGEPGDFYASSEQLLGVWTSLGNEGEGHFLKGGQHKDVESFDAIVRCLGNNGANSLLGLNSTERGEKQRRWEPVLGAAKGRQREQQGEQQDQQQGERQQQGSSFEMLSKKI